MSNVAFLTIAVREAISAAGDVAADAGINARISGRLISVKLYTTTEFISHSLFETSYPESIRKLTNLSKEKIKEYINYLYYEQRTSVTGIAQMLMLEPDEIYRQIDPLPGRIATS